MRVGWDLDGVVYPFVESMRHVVLRRTRVGKPLPTPRQWEMWHDWQMTQDEWDDHFEAGVADGSLFTFGGPMDHGTINAMHDTHSIHIVTHRPAAAHATTRAWLREHAIRYDTLTFSENKASVDTHVFLDDKPENVEAVHKAGGLGILFDQPWNQRAEGLRRVHSWRQFRDVVKEIGG